MKTLIILAASVLISSSVSATNKRIVVDLNQLLWVATENNQIIRTGKAVGGAKRCPEWKRSCKTPAGSYTVLAKFSKHYRSHKYPVECKNFKECGAKMPYFMKFHKEGIGLHGSFDLPNHNASHGCVRLDPKEAEWLNKQFITKDTVIEILPY